MFEQKPSFDIIGPDQVNSEPPPDNRTRAQRMFYDLDKSGNLVTIPIVIPPEGGYKQLHDCIPFMPEYRAEDAEYDGPLKGRDVVVIGGRRRSRAGTGVEFTLCIDEIDDFVVALQAIKEKISQYSNTE